MTQPNPTPSRLEDLDAEAVYTDSEGAPYRVAYVCPDPALSGVALDEANLRVLKDRDDSWVREYRHWTWARYTVVLLPPDEALAVRELMEVYPALDEAVLADVEAEQEQDQ